MISRQSFKLFQLFPVLTLRVNKYLFGFEQNITSGCLTEKITDRLPVFSFAPLLSVLLSFTPCGSQGGDPALLPGKACFLWAAALQRPPLCCITGWRLRGAEVSAEEGGGRLVAAIRNQIDGGELTAWKLTETRASAGGIARLRRVECSGILG